MTAPIQATQVFISKKTAPAAVAKPESDFQVASFLVPDGLRPHVEAFIAFTKAARAIANDPGRTLEERTILLNTFDKAILQNRPVPVTDTIAPASALRASLVETGINSIHARHVLQAYVKDVTTNRLRNWSALLALCRYSAAPIGRYFSELSGQPQSLWRASDALCSAIQILCQVRDCKRDYDRLDRVYLPAEWLRQAGTTAEALAEDSATPAIRQVLDRVLDGVDRLLVEARPGLSRIASRGLRIHAIVSYQLAVKLTRKLRRRDPIAHRVGLGKIARQFCLLEGIVRGYLYR